MIIAKFVLEVVLCLFGMWACYTLIVLIKKASDQSDTVNKLIEEKCELQRKLREKGGN